MAVSKIWSIKTNLTTVINYVVNEEKTNEELFQDLHKEINYIANDIKTEEKLYVSGINCDSKTAKQEFVKVKKRFNKVGGITVFHAIQSFKENEVTPEEAHKIGKQLAREMWGDKFQVVVATHLNTNHLHNHFVINSVSFIDGYKYHATSTSYAKLREVNDRICKENNISYLEEKKNKIGCSYTNLLLKEENNNIYDKQLKSDVDMAIGLSNSYEDFIKMLENMNYEVYERSGKLNVMSLEYNRSARLERRFGNDYSIENITKRILGIYLPEQKIYYKNYFKRDELIDKLFKMNCKGLAMRYIKYLKILNNYPTYVKVNRISYSMIKDVHEMENISNQTILLAENNINTKEDLINLYTKLKKDLSKNDNQDARVKIQLINEIIKRTELTDEDSERENKRDVVIR